MIFITLDARLVAMAVFKIENQGDANYSREKPRESTLTVFATAYNHIEGLLGRATGLHLLFGFSR